jgi:hypothetical protein
MGLACTFQFPSSKRMSAEFLFRHISVTFCSTASSGDSIQTATFVSCLRLPYCLVRRQREKRGEGNEERKEQRSTSHSCTHFEADFRRKYCVEPSQGHLALCLCVYVRM